MSEQTEFEQSHDVPEGQEPRVVYVERDRGLVASVRRLRQRAGEAGRRWVAESVVDTDVDGQEDGYGLGWWVDRDGSNRINDPGAYGAVPWLMRWRKQVARCAACA